MTRNVLTLSHLYPRTTAPGLGPFVRDEVMALAKRNGMVVVSPVPRSLLPFGRVQSGPGPSLEDVDGGVRVVRPDIPGLPVGGPFLESRVWASRLAPLLRRLYRELSGDLVHAHFALPDGFAAAEYARRDGAPFVLTVWGSDVMVYGTRRSLRGTLRSVFDRARAVIAVSQELAERAEALGASADRLRVIPGGVPFAPCITRSEARSRLGLPADTACVLWIGGLVPVKQPLQAVEAFRLLAASGIEDATLVMIGDGPLRGELTAVVRRNGLGGAVRLLGHLSREEVWTWQCAADLLVNSSRSEGTPLAVLETLGAGTPVVGYPVGGVGAAVDAVAGGRLAGEKTPCALAAAVTEELAARRDRERLSSAARDAFDIARIAREIEDVYEAVL